MAGMSSTAAPANNNAHIFRKVENKVVLITGVLEQEPWAAGTRDEVAVAWQHVATKIGPELVRIPTGEACRTKAMALLKQFRTTYIVPTVYTHIASYTSTEVIYTGCAQA